ncbi:MAG TPA: type II toxin-antitoxin system prevent-host-death family antitoxin [Tepidisphaeraceae bacterium]|jgi:prevent-host-death family protein|nr:type II toxin-antitoxin system prevent-host-death family antitoxin [Tepidisphaeraceae bacterium]
MKQVTLEQARGSLAELVTAAVGGEEVVLLSDENHPTVRLVPVEEVVKEGHPQFGSARGLITMSDDFDEPLAGYLKLFQNLI